MLKDTQQVTLIQSLYLRTRKWGSGEVRWLAQGHKVELITEWRRCPQSPDSRLLRKLQNKLAGREITSERQQSHCALGEPPLLEEPWEPSCIPRDPPADGQPLEQGARHSRAAPRKAWQGRQPRVFLQFIPAILPSGQRKYIIGLATILLKKNAYLIDQNCTKKYLEWTLQNTM